VEEPRVVEERLATPMMLAGLEQWGLKKMEKVFPRVEHRPPTFKEIWKAAQVPEGAPKGMFLDVLGAPKRLPGVVEAEQKRAKEEVRFIEKKFGVKFDIPKDRTYPHPVSQFVVGVPVGFVSAPIGMVELMAHPVEAVTGIPSGIRRMWGVEPAPRVAGQVTGALAFSYGLSKFIGKVRKPTYKVTKAPRGEVTEVRAMELKSPEEWGLLKGRKVHIDTTTYTVKGRPPKVTPPGKIKAVAAGGVRVDVLGAPVKGPAWKGVTYVEDLTLGGKLYRTPGFAVSSQFKWLQLTRQKFNLYVLPTAGKLGKVIKKPKGVVKTPFGKALAIEEDFLSTPLVPLSGVADQTMLRELASPTVFDVPVVAVEKVSTGVSPATAAFTPAAASVLYQPSLKELEWLEPEAVEPFAVTPPWIAQRPTPGIEITPVRRVAITPEVKVTPEIKGETILKMFEGAAIKPEVALKPNLSQSPSRSSGGQLHPLWHFQSEEL